MELWELIAFSVVGIAGGVLSGLVGVGGGIIFVPALVYLAGWNIEEAVAASLGIIVFSSISGVIRSSYSNDPVDWKSAGLLSITGAPSALLGVAIHQAVSEEVVQVSFSILLLVLALPTARGRKDVDGGGRTLPLPAVLAFGAAVGTLSGLLGVGGGVVMVPLLVLGLGLETKRAVSTSLAVVILTGLVGVSGYLYTGFDELSTLPPLIVGAVFGALLGVRIRDWVPSNALRVGFAVLMLFIALRGLFEVFSS